MDIQHAFLIVTERIKKLEPPDLATRIVGYLLFHYGEEEIIRLAHYSDQTTENVVLFVKNKLSLVVNNHLSAPISPELAPKPVGDLMPVFNKFPPPGFCSPIAVKRPASNWDALVSTYQKLPYHDVLTEIPKKIPYLRLVESYDQGAKWLSNHFSEERRPDFVKKLCHYFRIGSCKKGNSCRYIHELPSQDGSHFVNDEHMFLPGSPNMLEMEIIQLLKMSSGEPIEIASLPSVYSAIYGKPLLGNEYPTERQRIDLLKRLRRMKSSICVIDRPRGQPSIVLAEDARRYLEYRSSRNSPSCKQIYLTFPKESTFTEDDVAQYFSKFGIVEDVRIPNQPERMFGFVTFSNSETVDQILSMRIHHLVGETEVLVKHYREMRKLPDRRSMEPLIPYPRQYANVDSDFIPTPRGQLESAMVLRREQQGEQYIDGQRHMEFQLARNNADSLDTQFPKDDATHNYTDLNSTQELRLSDNSPVSRSMTTTTTCTDL